MYPTKIEIKDTKESNTSASYLYLFLLIGIDGQFHTSLYNKYDIFNFHIKNLSLLSSTPFHSPITFYLTAHTVYQGMFFLWMFYSGFDVTFL